jgi:hypothetical protein
MAAVIMHKGSYKQLQDKAPVFMLAGGKVHYIGVKRVCSAKGLSSLIPLKIKTDDDRFITLNKKLARCCFGFYEVINEQQQTA